jgi:hypothetical protein
MTRIHNVSHQPLPSSILHNGNDVRRQYTRAAARKAFLAISYKLGTLRKSAADYTKDYQPGIQA